MEHTCAVECIRRKKGNTAARIPGKNNSPNVINYSRVIMVCSLLSQPLSYKTHCNKLNNSRPFHAPNVPEESSVGS